LRAGVRSFYESSGRWSVDATGLLLPESVHEVIDRSMERLDRYELARASARTA
jgi:hypothetical protein